jgi:hypothetical protein
MKKSLSLLSLLVAIPMANAKIDTNTISEVASKANEIVSKAEESTVKLFKGIGARGNASDSQVYVSGVNNASKMAREIKKLIKENGSIDAPILDLGGSFSIGSSLDGSKISKLTNNLLDDIDFSLETAVILNNYFSAYAKLGQVQSNDSTGAKTLGVKDLFVAISNFNNFGISLSMGKMAMPFAQGNTTLATGSKTNSLTSIKANNITLTLDKEIKGHNVLFNASLGRGAFGNDILSGNILADIKFNPKTSFAFSVGYISSAFNLSAFNNKTKIMESSKAKYDFVQKNDSKDFADKSDVASYVEHIKDLNKDLNIADLNRSLASQTQRFAATFTNPAAVVEASFNVNNFTIHGEGLYFFADSYKMAKVRVNDKNVNIASFGLDASYKLKIMNKDLLIAVGGDFCKYGKMFDNKQLNVTFALSSSLSENTNVGVSYEFGKNIIKLDGSFTSDLMGGTTNIAHDDELSHKINVFFNVNF